ncbi:MAG: hypothetical protein Q4D51_12800 [Eubacteriales bacterium]|nr:hypothetical protein [Eubacteriales bacterium]
MKLKKLDKHNILYMIIFTFAVCVLFTCVDTAHAKKYYTLREIGMSDCACDQVDYNILSVRGRTLKYEKYEKIPNSTMWRKVGDVKSAKLTKNTKYYMGNSRKISVGTRKKLQQEVKNQFKKNNKANTKKQKMDYREALNAEKWIYRIQKKNAKKGYSSRNNHLVIEKGKVIKWVTQLGIK